MNEWDKKWGPVIAERKARQDAGLKERVERIDRGLAEREEKFKPNYMQSLPEPRSTLAQGGRSVAAIDVNVDTKIDTVQGPVADPSASTITFNGTVGICINGTPYWINIVYDTERGPYLASGTPDFPIDEP
jgi:hypothetical protein